MSRILCAKSGVEFKVEHFSLYLTGRQVSHPIFTLSSKELLKDYYIQNWMEGKNSSAENYLYYLALFNSTRLIDFRIPAIRTAKTDAIIAQNMDALINCLETITDMDTELVHAKLNLPRISIDTVSQDLENSNHWIEVWLDNYADYQNAYKSINVYQKLSRQESILERLIKDHTRCIEDYAPALASWAITAGDIDTDYICYNEYNKPEQLTSYYRRIIIACAKTERIFEIPDEHLDYLIEYFEDNIHHGSIYANSLMTLLRAGSERKRNFLDLGDIDIGTDGRSTFRILDADTSVADANMLAMILTAPTSKPVEKDYPNKLAYIRAKMKYDTAQNYNASIEASKAADSANNPKTNDDDNDAEVAL